MNYTKVFATPEQIQEIKDSRDRPAIALQCGPVESTLEVVHRCALTQGLPEITGYYGIDLSTGEFLRY